MHARNGVAVLALWITLATFSPIETSDCHAGGRYTCRCTKTPPSNVGTRANPGDSDTWVTRVIPIELDNTTNADKTLWDNVMLALAAIKDHVPNCLKFVRKKIYHLDYISITGHINDGCYSAVGKRGGKQILNVGSSCNDVGIIVHELMHALGFWHEHSRHDRDRHIEVLFDNIRDDAFGQFSIRNDSIAMEKAVPYDIGSIMHYKRNEFARIPSVDTIVPKDKSINPAIMGQRKRLSALDIQRVKWLYKCGEYKISGCLKPDWKVDITPVISSPLYPVGAKIRYTCSKDGWFLAGPRFSICKANGEWSGAVPMCFDSTKKQYLSLLNFETNMMDTNGARWYKMSTFKINSGQTPSADTGPHSDHTNQVNAYNQSSGNYLYLEATGLSPGTIALLHSPMLRFNDPNMCILFYYNMYGAGMGELEITVCSYYWFNCPWTTKLTRKMPDNDWYLFSWSVNIASARYGFVRVTAKRGQTDTSDIALDDLMVGPCTDVWRYGNSTMATEKQDEFDTYTFDDPNFKP